MPEKSGFFDTTADDPRQYPAREFAEYFSRFIGNGIFGGGTNLKVTATGTDNKVSIQTGWAWINGYIYSIFNEPLTLTIPLATDMDRIDRIILRLNVSTPVRSIKAMVLQGTPGVSPTPPAIVRSGDIYDISLAQVYMVANEATVQPGNITDERLNTAVCGIVTGLIEQADTTSIFNEFDLYRQQKQIEFAQAWNTWFATATANFEGDWDVWFDQTKQEWQDWFDNAQDLLIPDGAVTDSKLSNAPGDIKARFAGHEADYVKHAGYGVASGTNAKTITLNPPPTAYVDGMAISFKNTTQNTGAVTLNVNGLGAKPVLKPNGNTLVSGALKADSVYTVRYNGTNFILQGEGGSGTAQPSEVLTGKTFSNDLGDYTGTMPNRGNVSATLTQQGQEYIVPAGYHAGAGKVKAQFANLTPPNVRQGVNIGGVVGTLDPIPTFTPGEKIHFMVVETSLNTFNSTYDPTEFEGRYIQPKYTGLYRIKYKAWSVSGTCHARLYNLTTGQFIGTERSFSGTTRVTFTEDLEIQAGHKIVVALRAPSSATAYFSNFRFCADADPLFETSYLGV